MKLSDRQQQLLRAVVVQYTSTRRPVGSKTLVSLGVCSAGPSTVRSELERLERMGLLQHPHTSAGREPTDLGFRTYVDQLVERDSSGRPVGTEVRVPLPSAESSAEVERALRETTDALAKASQLLAIVTAPAAERAVVRHVEVLLLQPQVVVVVCITTSGDVSRRVILLEQPADPGLVEWATSYLNEQVAGLALGQNLLRSRLRDPQLSSREREMLATLEPAFEGLISVGEQMYLGGTTNLIDELADPEDIAGVVRILEERERLLQSLRTALGQRATTMRIGAENDLPELRRTGVVAAAYGPAGAGRPLGIVGLIGPRAMDYPRALAAARSAADNLSLLLADDHGRH